MRIPIDVLMVFTANPEDYTNRGSIITPLKDRIDSQILTHYPRELGIGVEITRQEAWSGPLTEAGGVTVQRAARLPRDRGAGWPSRRARPSTSTKSRGVSGTADAGGAGGLGL